MDYQQKRAVLVAFMVEHGWDEALAVQTVRRMYAVEVDDELEALGL